MATLSFSRQAIRDHQQTNIQWTIASETCTDASNGALIPENLSRKWARQRPQRLCKKNLNDVADLRAPGLVAEEYADVVAVAVEDLAAVLVVSLGRSHCKTELWRFMAVAQAQQALNAYLLRPCHPIIGDS